MKRLGLISLVSGLAAAPAAAQPVVQQWSVSAGGNGHFYAVVPFGAGAQATWASASARAVSMNGSLACITSPAENDFVFNLCNDLAYWFDLGDSRRFGPWLGGHQPAGSFEPDGGWAWTSGEPWTMTNWAPAEPNNYGGNEDALHFYTATSARGSTWNDLASTTGLLAFMAEFDCIYVLAQPAPQFTCPFGTARFTFDAGGESPAYRWQVEAAPAGSNQWFDLFDGPVPGSSAVAGDCGTTSLTIRNADSASAARYRCRISTACGSLTSDANGLTVGPCCYANCDQSTQPPILSVIDFFCFLNGFATGDPYANCDHSTTPPVLNILDFTCFLNAFASGCP